MEQILTDRRERKHKMEQITLRQLINVGTKELESVGIVEAANDAWLLMAWVFNISRLDYLLDPETPADPDLAARYRECIKLRGENIPLQHITGEQNFMGFSFKVNRDVLIPRQDTEVLVETVLDHIPRDGSVLDMCTGSGCILLSIAAMASCDCCDGADLSERALAVAGENEVRLRKMGNIGISGTKSPKIRWIHSDLFENVRGRYDVIVSNPPYIPSGQIFKLMAEVRCHEPLMALDGSRDGLEFYRKITVKAPEYLKPGGMLFFEIGWDQADAVSKLLELAGFDQIHVKKDLAGLDRVVYGSL
ncbi:release factor glutamine methyltransferase [Catenibacillus scindens]|uniref:Release factor glutamine methyltransferase n=1 Tax=Catenibacillus scindens TaxID=673271 RepID=A0A7W8HC98_9FIRM|nr:peptide chain release factor N(5)-glutamine methyltransferase [Catenibacillus scindens]MBB5265669.1 release factor glutamine methyltransferase [Catenibacillus scindens]